MSEKTQSRSSASVKIQSFGRFMSGMIMPNMGAFIAWGLITAFFIPTGWLPNEKFATLVGPMINFLLPLLIGYTGGKLVHDVRGGVVGAAATMGVIVGADIPMFMGAMIMGPLGGYLIKLVDKVLENKIRTGFEMLVNNFTAGILAVLLPMLGLVAIGPVVLGLNNILEAGVDFIVSAGLLPLANIFIEPAKVLFLNNAINHGVLGPLGVKESAELGKSIFFMMESNPGPGLGILLAYMIAGKGNAKQSAPGAVIIHFFGGIHEIYFPYILMNPKLILAAIGGGVSGVFTFSLLKVGLVATPSPGSIFAYIAMTPRGDHLGVLLGVLVAAVVSFLIASILLKATKGDTEDLSAATEKMEALKGKKSSVAQTTQKAASDVKKVIFACDAGMGSSAMGASLLRNKFKSAGLDIDVTNVAINDLPEDVDIVITQQSLTPRAKEKVPNAEHVSVDNFLGSPKYDELTQRLTEK
ncbi:PTS mannitol transporter subunit IICB [Alkalibacter rhizosphaerae]|uniref:PTS system mannitol-specific EIICB component n=1 Tax=Alkalibacter rhizosphaerae TaxID=2815577 RepID=A0A974XD61_9FIRM|nr:PTS mannitol transporter subunit IICB [Alkalibacter rhizosphaerae]QSX07541.1 PTS mannitol transporter subunit IICB [Alkalibacter rhizosphaerae]